MSEKITKETFVEKVIALFSSIKEETKEEVKAEAETKEEVKAEAETETKEEVKPEVDETKEEVKAEADEATEETKEETKDEVKDEVVKTDSEIALEKKVEELEAKLVKMAKAPVTEPVIEEGKDETPMTYAAIMAAQAKRIRDNQG